MACSSIRSASSSSHTKNFDVFVSFRGTDTRNGFISHLFAALQRKGVVAFRDDQKIKKGELLEPELMEAIEGSRVFIIVFSKDYASSTWCMKELVKILDWVEETGRSVIPIFYDVTPSEVRKQSGKFEKAFAKYEERFKDDLDMIQTWRATLKSITDRCGWDMQNKSQHEEIEKIVAEVINLLGHNQILTFDDNLVDMDFRVKQLEELLDLDTNDVVRVIGICGMGGIGKTTLANALFSKISQQYDACCFIDDVSKNFKDFGPTSVQKQLLCQVLKLENIEIHNLFQGTMLVRTRLCHLKTLIILDNVDRVEQLEKFALHPRYLGTGSRIIIISRDERILKNYGADKVYNVELLNMDKSLQLFCKNAFKSNVVVKECKELTYDALNYAKGLPLAIKVLGSFLFDRDIYEWRSALIKLKENPNKDIMDVLRTSFDGLEKNEKEIFLDIACFSFDKLIREEVKKLLSIRGFYTDIGLKILSEKSLISYTNWGGIHMHDLLKELGRSIVQEKYPKEPRKWSRLWDYKDFHKVMMENKEAKILEVIIINTHDKSELLEETMKVDTQTKMNHLKLLILKNVNLSGIFNYHYNELRYLSWEEYPYSSLSSTFHPKQLVELNLRCSNIKQLWEGRKCLPNLRVLLLGYSTNLLEIPDLRGVPHLEKLDLEGCVEIMWIDPSIGILKELTFLNLRNCKNLLLDLNIILGLNSLKCLDVSGCLKLLNSHLLKKPRETEYLEKVDENASVIQLSTSSVYEMLKLPFYFFSSRKYEDSLGLLVPYLSRLSCLLSLDLSFCNLFKVPDAIGSLHSLESLKLGGNKFVTLPTTIKELSKLQRLNLEHCKQLKYLPKLPTTKEKTTDKYFGGLYVFNCPNLSEMEHCYRMIFSWMIQIFKVYWQSSLSFRCLNIVIPGSQIPRWFSIQNVGRSISMDLSPVIEDENWIGVACCALLVAHDEPTHFGQRWDNDNRLYDYGSIGFSFQNKQDLPTAYSLLPIHLKNDLVTGELDHLFIWFLSREEFLHYPRAYRDKRYDLDTRRFIALIWDHPKGLRLVAKNCGYRWVFKDDVEQLNPDTMFRGYSSSGKHKLLTSD